MKKALKAATLAASLLLLTVVAVLSINWSIATNYSIKFSGTKAQGSFTGLMGTIDFDKNQLGNAKIDVSVEASTINTGNSTKDRHAKGENWFDVAKYPRIKFTSTRFAKQADQFLVTGMLELHGTKKEVSIPFNYTENGGNAIFNGSFKINRKDYGIKGNMMGFMVGDEFVVTLNIPVTK